METRLVVTTLRSPDRWHHKVPIGSIITFTYQSLHARLHALDNAAPVHAFVCCLTGRTRGVWIIQDVCTTSGTTWTDEFCTVRGQCETTNVVYRLPHQQTRPPPPHLQTDYSPSERLLEKIMPHIFKEIVRIYEGIVWSYEPCNS
jgi:hypothetical protein